MFDFSDFQTPKEVYPINCRELDVSHHKNIRKFNYIIKGRSSYKLSEVYITLIGSKTGNVNEPKPDQVRPGGGKKREPESTSVYHRK